MVWMEWNRIECYLYVVMHLMYALMLCLSETIIVVECQFILHLYTRTSPREIYGGFLK